MRIPIPSVIVFITCDANWGPRSDMILFGVPYRRNVVSMRSLAVPSASMVLVHGVSMIVLVHLSVHTRIASYLFEGGRSVMKSMVIVSNGRSGISVGCRGSQVGCVIFLVSWHVAHPSTKFFTKMDMPGHQKLRWTISKVLNRPGCP